MKVLYIYGIKCFIIRFYKFLYKNLCTVFIFSYFLSCMMHVVIIVVLRDFLYKKKLIDVKKPEMVAFSVYQVDQFFYKVLKQQKLLNSTTALDNKKRELKANSYFDKLNANMEVCKDKLSHSKISTSSEIVSPQQQCRNNNTITSSMTDFSYLLSSNKNIVNYNKVYDKAIPNVINRLYPEYPIYAKTLGIEGKLIVVYNIDNLGKIENIRILFAAPVGIFEKNVLSAMRFWRYESNQPRKDIRIIFKFCLHNSSIEISNAQRIR